MEILKYICHRKPERSFFFKNHQFPVCARCTGFYIGLGFFLIADYIHPINANVNIFLLSIVLMMPALCDGLTQYFGPRKSNNYLRLITGFAGGIGLIMFLKTVLLHIIV